MLPDFNETKPYRNFLVARTLPVVPNFDPWRTQVVRVKYDQYPGFEVVCEDLQRRGLIPLGMHELIATAKLAEALATFSPPDSIKNTRKRRKETDVRLQQLGELSKKFESSQNGEVTCSAQGALYVGTTFVESDPRLRELVRYPHFGFGLQAYLSEHLLGMYLIPSGFFMNDVACIRQ